MAQHWFKHDYSARNDEKILELRAEYGWKGYGLFFALVETMCETETGCIDTDRIGGLSVGFSLPKDELLGFIDFCLNIDLLYEDDDGLIKNKRVIEHLDHMNTLKEAGKKGANKRWKGHKNRGANGVANTTPNADKNRIDKNREDNISPLVSDYSNIKSMEEPLTEEQGETLVEQYGETAVKEILMQMENWKPLKKKNKSANLTAHNWLKKRNDSNGNNFNPEHAKRMRGAFK